MMLIRQVRRSLRALGFTGEPQRVLVAVSGGADSVALLRALHALRGEFHLSLRVAHLHHGLRGAEADADARCVRDLAAELGLPSELGRAPVRRQAAQRGLSIEMAARDARYAFLARTARRWARSEPDGAPVVLMTAHTADDQAETLLLRLARGAGTRGLGGMRPERVLAGLRLVRPMLAVRRRDVLAYLRRLQQPWREDASNADVAILRNRVRRQVLPLLAQTLNPAIVDALVRTGDVLQADEDWMEAMAQDLLTRLQGPGDAADLPVAGLDALPVAARRRVLRLWLVRAGVRPEALDLSTVDRVAMLARQRRGSGGFVIEGLVRVERRYAHLHVAVGRASPPAAAPFRRVVRVPGKTDLRKAGLCIWAGEGTAIVRETGRRPGQLPSMASLSRQRLGTHALVVRSWRPGDRIAPFGMKGTVKVQDLLVNAKVPRAERGRVPILECAGEIVWIPGYRIARGWEVTPGDLRTLELRISRR